MNASRHKAIDLEIFPFGRGNRIHLGSHQRVGVAILGAEDFDVTDVDVTTLAFGPDGAPSIPGPPPPAEPLPRIVDVDRDGLVDLLVLFDVAATGSQADATEACLTGATLGGTPFEGCDPVEVVGLRGAQP